MRIRKYRYFACDFETTVYKGQENTEVWASACVELYTENVKIFHSISEQFDYFCSLNDNIIGYYHNLKFDGTFWLSFLMVDLQLKQAYEKIGNSVYNIQWMHEKDMPNNSFKYSISDRGQWYSIIIKKNNHIIELRDSLKLLPFSLKRIGESFRTKHKKLEMEYEGFRYAGCPISEDEQKYIGNDVLVLKEALEFMYNEGHNKLTIGSCCLEEFKQTIPKGFYDKMFPNMYEYIIDSSLFDYYTAGEYIHKSYKGGWCYLVKGKENKLMHNGTTADVNSLYPSMMHSQSGNVYPIGNPTFWKGNYIPEEAIGDHKYYFIRIKTRFKIKNDKLPFIQIKGSWLYKGTEALTTSDIYSKKDNKYYQFYTDVNGSVHDTRVTLTLTCTDYILFREHYDVYEFEILDGCYFSAVSGIFDQYIDKYKKLKMESTGAMRELAKLFLNNLCGKMAASTDSSFKVGYEDDNKIVEYFAVDADDKKPGFIPIGSAITSYARNFTIRAAQANYHGVDKAGFIYADTDSIHCDLPPEKINGIIVDDKDFCCWKLESCWDTAIFVRQKTYIEHIVMENLNKIDSPYNNIKCAGMPDKCKNLFELSMQGTADINGYISDVTGKHHKWEDDEKEFLFSTDGLPIIRTYNDFRVGLKIPGKLMPKRIRGGTLLVETTYEMRLL